MTLIEVIKGDITKQEVDVIVNAANESLMGGGGVDGAIHKAAGQDITIECSKFPKNKDGDRCTIGNCRMTQGYDLPALYVLHAVGPRWKGGNHDELDQLHACYGSCLRMAQLQGLNSIAFPCISTGAFAVPKDVACKEAIEAIKDWLEYQDCIDKMLPETINQSCSINLVRIVCFDDENYQNYLELVSNNNIKHQAESL